jgi:cbb3-type cytochrome oxidase subunit 3
MSQLFRETALSLGTGSDMVMGGMTLLFMTIFLAWTWYAYAPSRKAEMESYGRLPFDGDTP